MAEKTKEVAAPATPKKVPASIYIGPTKMGRLHVVERTIFKGGVLPKYLQELAKKDKNFASLVVAKNDLGAALAELKVKDSELARAYRAFAKEV